MARVDRGYSSDDAALYASALEWWAEAGADALVQDAPRDWLKPRAPAVPPAVQARSADEPRLAPRAQPAEELPGQLALFHDWLRASDALPYAAPGAPRVCPSGDPASGLIILTAMPSGEDCDSGTFLSGAAGRLFDRMLAAIGRSRDTIYLAGLSCVRPAAGTLDAAGAARCADIARHHILLAEPRIVLLLGDACAQALAGTSVAQGRGRIHSIGANGRSFNAILTLHPEILLTQPSFKAHAWADLQLLMEALK